MGRGCLVIADKENGYNEDEDRDDQTKKREILMIKCELHFSRELEPLL